MRKNRYTFDDPRFVRGRDLRLLVVILIALLINAVVYWVVVQVLGYPEAALRCLERTNGVVIVTSLAFAIIALVDVCIVALIASKAYNQLGFTSAIVIIVVAISAFACLHMISGIHAGDGNVVTDQWDYLYFSAISFTTVGYGDFAPCVSGRFAAAIEGVFGIIMMPLLVVFFLQTIVWFDDHNRHEEDRETLYDLTVSVRSLEKTIRDNSDDDISSPE